MPSSQAGDLIGRYRLLAPFHTGGGGNCEWTFAVIDGTEEFFIKRFFEPKFPISRNGKPPPGNAASREAECLAFERDQRKLMDAARAVAGRGGRLIVPTDLFRVDSFYYKVSPKVDAVGLTMEQITALGFDEKRKIMGTVVSALLSLSSAKIVHGDLSPANILISSRDKGYGASVIDFDSSFLDGEPPPAAETMGNPPYYSPELLNYINNPGSDRALLTTKSDIFALGVVFWEYLFGTRPSVDGHKYTASAVASGLPIAVPGGTAPRGAVDLVLSMLQLDPNARPTLRAIQVAIKDGFPDHAAPTGGAAPTPTPTPTHREERRTVADGSRIRRSNFGRATSPETPPPTPGGPSRIRKSGFDRPTSGEAP